LAYWDELVNEVDGEIDAEKGNVLSFHDPDDIQDDVEYPEDPNIHRKTEKFLSREGENVSSLASETTIVN